MQKRNVTNNKMSSFEAIFFSSITGGALGAFYLISRNFLLLKSYKQALISMLVGIIFIFALHGLSITLPPNDNLPGLSTISILTMLVPIQYARHFQTSKINFASITKNKTNSWLTTIIVTAISFTITSIAGMPGLVLLEEYHRLGL